MSLFLEYKIGEAFSEIKSKIKHEQERRAVRKQKNLCHRFQRLVNAGAVRVAPQRRGELARL